MRNTNIHGFTIYELLFIIVIVFFAVTGVSQMMLFNTRAKTSTIERSLAVEYANTVMEQYVAESQNSPSTFWVGFSASPTPLTTVDASGNYSYVYKRADTCARVCGTVTVTVVMARGGATYTLERSFSVYPTITLTPTPTPTPTFTPTPTPP